jgi:hypothetical protein
MKSGEDLVKLFNTVQHNVMHKDVNAAEARELFTLLLIDAQVQVHLGDRDKAAQEFATQAMQIIKRIQHWPEAVPEEVLDS